MTKRYTECILLACAFLFSLSLTSNACAADVNELVASCVSCHGKNGASTEPDVPIIGGYSTDFLIDNLKAYKDRQRVCLETEIRTGSKKGTKTDMCKVVDELEYSDIEQVAKFFGKQEFTRPKQKFDPVLADKGKELHEKNCEICHSEGGTVSTDESGMPAGQWMTYLKEAFKEFKSGERPISKKMKLRLEGLSEDDISALINYYGSFGSLESK